MQIADLEPLGLAELDHARAEQLAAAYRIPLNLIGSAGDLADYAGELDCAVVFTLKEHHAAAIIPLLEAGVPVFTEKPLPRLARRLGTHHATASMRTGTEVMVGYMRQLRSRRASLPRHCLLNSKSATCISPKLATLAETRRWARLTLHALPIEPQPDRLIRLGLQPRALLQRIQVKNTMVEWIEVVGA